MNRRAFIAVMGGAVVGMSVGEKAYGSLLARRPFYRKPGPGAKINGAHPLAFGLQGLWLFQNQPARIMFDSVFDPASNRAAGGALMSHDATHADLGVGSLGGWDNNSTFTVTQNAHINDLFFTAGQQITLLAWVQLANASSRIIAKTSGGSNGWILAGTGGPPLTTLRFQKNASLGTMTVDATGLSAVTWYQYVVVSTVGASLTASNYSVYINGHPVSTTNANGAGAQATDAAQNLVFTSQGGVLDHVAIWNRALSGTDVSTLFCDPMCFMAPTQGRSMLAGAGVPVGVSGHPTVIF